MTALDVFIDEVQLVPRGGLDEVDKLDGSYLYAIASAPRRRLRELAPEQFCLEERLPDETWQPIFCFNLREHTVHCEAPWTDIAVKGPSPSGPENGLLWHLRWAAEVAEAGGKLAPVELEVHYIGRTWGTDGQKTAKDRLTEGHKKLEAVGAHLSHHRNERLVHLIVIKPGFYAGYLDASGQFQQTGVIEPTNELVAAAEGALIEWFSPCLDAGPPGCLECFNDKTERKHLDIVLGKYAEVAVGGIDPIVTLASPHRRWPTAGDAAVLSKH